MRCFVDPSATPNPGNATAPITKKRGGCNPWRDRLADRLSGVRAPGHILKIYGPARERIAFRRGIPWVVLEYPADMGRRSVPFAAVLCDELGALRFVRIATIWPLPTSVAASYGTPTGVRGFSGLRWRNARPQMRRSRPSRRTTSVTSSQPRRECSSQCEGGPADAGPR